MPWRSLAGLCLGLLTLSIAVGHGRFVQSLGLIRLLGAAWLQTDSVAHPF